LNIMEVAHITAGLALHTLDKPSEDTSSLQIAKSPTILRCWNREQVRYLIKDGLLNHKMKR